ncbi:MAG: hypothetical protein IT324_22450, partial [Anaerolineae bacterium]|nr:hypothetical protein [Anaerolineae bacterium]
IVPGLVAGALFVGWTYYLFFGLDRALRDIPAEQALLRATTNGAFFRVDLIQNIGNFLSISHSGAGIFLIPTLLYHLLQHRRNPERLHRTLPMFVMLILAVGLYVFSIGWERYAFPVWGLFIPYLAAMLVEIAAQIPVRLRDWRTRLASEGLTGSLLTGIVLTGMMIQVIAFPLFKQAYTVYSNNADDVYRLAQYLNTNAKPDALIETWEHEIAVLTNHKYHFPPTFAMIASTKDIEGAKVYDFRDYVNPDYVIIGPFALNKSVYTADRLVNYDLVKTAGMYKVYAKRAGVGSP